MPSLVPSVLPPGRLSSGPQPVLRAAGDRLLRPWTVGDAPAVLAAFADPAIRHWNRRSMVTGNEARTWIGDWSRMWAAETDACWAVVDLATDAVVGRVALRGINLAAGQAECSYWVLPAARGRGVTPAAVDAVTAWAFGTVGFERLHIVHSVRNRASCRAATAAGFAWEGTLRRYQLLTDGWHDVHLHARVNDGAPPARTGPAARARRPARSARRPPA